MYQGHHQDGSSIQRHSAGSHYPYIVGKRESRGWFVLHPNGTEECRSDGEDAYACAEQLAAARNTRH